MGVTRQMTPPERRSEKRIGGGLVLGKMSADHKLLIIQGELSIM